MSIYIKLPHIFQIYRYILLDISLVGIIRYIQPQNHHDISQHIGIYRVFQDIFQYTVFLGKMHPILALVVVGGKIMSFGVTRSV